MRGLFGWLVPIALMLGAVIGVAACYGPTEVRVEVTRDVACAPYGMTSTGIFVGPPGHGPIAPTAETLDCTTTGAGAVIGSIVVVPSGDRDARVTVEVALTFDPRTKPAEDCLRDAKGCIVARRSFAFIEHTSRTLPIRLYEDCRDKTCDPGSTCVAAQCVSDDIESPTFCDNREACRLQEAPVDAGAERDAEVPGPCSGPKGNGILAADIAMPSGKMFASASTLYWPTGPAKTVAALTKSGVPANGVGASSPVTAVAVNGASLGFVETDKFHVVKSIDTVGFPAAATYSLPGVQAITLGARDVYVATATQTFALGVVAPGPTPGKFPSTGADVGAQWLATRDNWVYALEKTSLHRARDDDGVWSDFSTQGATDLVADPTGVFWTVNGTVPADSGILHLGDANVSPLRVATARQPREVAYDGTTVYWTDAATPGVAATRAEIWKLVGTVRTQVPTPELAVVKGLVVDAECLYYWGEPARAGARGSIWVGPK